MPFCPKCETEYRDGFETCADCDVDLVATLEPAADLEGVEEDFAREMFAEPTEVMWVCERCQIEYVEGIEWCEKCTGSAAAGAPVSARVTAVEREDWVTSLTRTTLTPWLEREEPGTPEGLACVWVARDPAEAGFAAMTLSGMGVPAEVGHDGLDGDGDPSLIGIWVAAEDAESAAVLVPDDPGEWRDEGWAAPEEGNPYVELVRRAEAYRGLGKYRHAVALAGEALEVEPRRYEAYLVLARAAAEMANHRLAMEAIGDAIERIGGAGLALAQELAVCAFLAHGGEPTFTGPEADRGYTELKRYCELHARDVRAQLLLLEAAHARGAASVVAETADRLDAVNPAVLRLDGPFSRMAGRA